MFRVGRSDLLQCLEAVQPGLSSTDSVDQSSCFVFKKGRVITYNDDVACRMKSGLPEDFEGAVTAAPLLEVLRKMTDDEIEVGPSEDESELTVRGKRKEVGVALQAKIIMPLDALEKPGEWAELHKNFCEAVGLVQACVSRDKDLPRMNCVHVTPHFVEASDNLQLTRWKMKTGFHSRVLVRQFAMKHVVPTDATEVSETPAWVHFRNPLGLVLSVRRYMEEENYPDFSGVANFSGEPATLPKFLITGADLTNVFSAENDKNYIRVEMRPGKVRLVGEGVTGRARVWCNIDYNGPEIAFSINPKLLADIVSRHDQCELTADKLKVDGGKWVYFTCLKKPAAAKTSKAEKEDK